MSIKYVIGFDESNSQTYLHDGQGSLLKQARGEEVSNAPLRMRQEIN